VGGVLSPLLANIALSAIEQRYERHVWPSKGSRQGQSGRPRESLSDPDAISRRAFENRANDKRRGRAVFVPVRYADDFIILVSAPPGQEHLAERFAYQEKAALASDLKQQLGLELSQDKTLVTPVTGTMLFLGHHIRVRDNRLKRRQIPTAVIPKERTRRLRLVIKGIFDRNTSRQTLSSRLKLLNPVLRGWGNFYRHAYGAKRIFSTLDHYVWWTIRRWLRKKHRPPRMREIHKRYGWRKPRGRMLRWRDGDSYPFVLSKIRVRPYRFTWMRPPDFAVKSMESPVRNERRTPGSARGRQKPAGAT
jgi:RNA-directed DNA polymerase